MSCEIFTVHMLSYRPRLAPVPVERSGSVPIG